MPSLIAPWQSRNVPVNLGAPAEGSSHFVFRVALLDNLQDGSRAQKAASAQIQHHQFHALIMYVERLLPMLKRPEHMYIWNTVIDGDTLFCG